MARKGFYNGLITGGILGAIFGLIMMPQKKPLSKRILGKTKDLTRASKVIKNVTDTVGDFIK
jgi:gas vesicle protein